MQTEEFYMWLCNIQYNALYCEYTISQEHSLLLEVVSLVFFPVSLSRTHTIDF